MRMGWEVSPLPNAPLNTTLGLEDTYFKCLGATKQRCLWQARFHITANGRIHLVKSLLLIKIYLFHLNLRCIRRLFVFRVGWGILEKILLTKVFINYQKGNIQCFKQVTKKLLYCKMLRGHEHLWHGTALSISEILWWSQTFKELSKYIFLVFPLLFVLESEATDVEH